MRGSFGPSLARARKASSSHTRAPLWALLFESIIRGITGVVVIFLFFILGTILVEGGAKVAGIDPLAAIVVTKGNQQAIVKENRLLEMGLDDDPASVTQTTYSPGMIARLAKSGGLLFEREGGLLYIREWDSVALANDDTIEYDGAFHRFDQFARVAVNGGALLIEPYVPSPSLSFLTQPPRQRMEAGGIFPAIFGTVFVVLFMILLALPIGVFGAVYMVEYTRGGFFARLIRAAVNNLAGVPSIVFGLFGLGFFVLFVGRHLDHLAFGTPRTDAEHQAYQERMEPIREEARAEAIVLAREQGLEGPERGEFVRSHVASQAPPPPSKKVFGQGAMFWAAATLAILVLPIIIVSTEEALRAVPGSTREAAYGLGATKWQVVRSVVLPQARSGILTGAILAVARGAGELAPILFVGVTFFAPDLPLTEPINFGLFEMPVVNPFKEFMHLNYHIYTMATQHPDPVGTRAIQFGTTLVLVAMTFLMNLGAIILRRRYAR